MLVLSTLCPQSLAQSLSYTRCSINTDWMNRRLTEGVLTPRTAQQWGQRARTLGIKAQTRMIICNRARM